MTEADHAASQQPAGKITQIRASAVAWQKIQFAVLGFIGLCGVLKGTGTSGGPHNLQMVAAILIVLALIVASYATFLVGRAAWPLYSADGPPPADPSMSVNDEIKRTSRSLRVGLGLTFVALILASLAATSSWWPAKGVSSAALISVSTTSGATLCGTWAGDSNGSLVLQFSGQQDQIPLSQITMVNPTSSCG
jgi:hypothetical protein